MEVKSGVRIRPRRRAQVHGPNPGAMAEREGGTSEHASSAVQPAQEAASQEGGAERGDAMQRPKRRARASAGGAGRAREARGDASSGESAQSEPGGRSPKKRLHRGLEDNVAVLQQLFTDCSDVQFRHLELEAGRAAALVYFTGMVELEELGVEALQPLLTAFHPHTVGDYDPRQLAGRSLPVAQADVVQTVDDVVDAIVLGRAVLFVDGFDAAVSLTTTSPPRRAISEPETESVVRGPREGFTEDITVNMSLLRQKLRTPKLKSIPYYVGTYTKTEVRLVYVEGLVDEKVIAEAKRRIEGIEIDGVLESGYLEELIEDQPLSPFPQFQYSERPDTVAAQLLEGRFAILTNGTPFALVAPVTWWQFLQASEDYYERFFLVYLVRVLRYVSLFIALFLPAMYIAVTTYHQDMLPTNLVISIAAARESIPFPAIIEALIMELTFEALREAGIRLPRAVGHAVSILGALVIGEAAVEAGIVSAPMVIIVALTGIASFTVPRYNAAIAIRLLRFPMMLLGAVLGMFGLVMGVMWVTIHLCKLRSFGVPYLSGFAPYKRQEVKDLFVRPPWWEMVYRPSSYAKQNRKRMNKQMMPRPEGNPQ